jgi:hypothetical protein
MTITTCRRNEVQIQIDNDTFQYGHEYVGLNPIFQVVSSSIS